MYDIQEKIELLREYFKTSTVEMAFLFGSFAKNNPTEESDIDIAIYLRPQGTAIEWESDTIYQQEDKIWEDVEKITGKEVDLVVLNRAPSILALEILRTGIQLVNNDILYSKFLSRISYEAIDLMNTLNDWYAIRQRSASLNEIDRQRLLRLIDFLEREIPDKTLFEGLVWQTYQNDSSKRRNIERWVENLVNSSIDISKILLASEKKPVPDTYREMLKNLALLHNFNEQVALQLSSFTKLRNILAHEYLDIRFNQIEKFLKNFEPAFATLLDFTKEFLKK